MFENANSDYKRAVLVGVDLTSTKAEGRASRTDQPDTGWTIDDSLDELAELAKTAGVIEVGRVTQKRPLPDGRFFIGEGKVDEAVAIARQEEADLLIFDDELQPAQVRNLESTADLGILDRTQIILDIFATRARSREGQLQVELAQLSYLLPRLRGSQGNLSRLGGGIGTRGPGETKLETDMRRIRTRISDLRAELKEVSAHREVLRKGREGARLPMGALVGYTNAGKSTLLNKLTGADVLAEDMLFATLDPTTRRAELPTGREILISDTVGFIRKLPHHLVAAFKATLEEVVWADFLIHVVDASNPFYEGQIHAVEEVLDDLGILNKSTLLVLNKVDLLDDHSRASLLAPSYRNQVHVSLNTGEGWEQLERAIDAVAYGSLVEATYLFGYQDIGVTQALRSHSKVLSEEYVEQGLVVKVQIDTKYEPIYARYRTS